MPESTAPLQEQFNTLEQQHDTARLGLWLFLATEVLFFGGLFMAYAIYYAVYPNGFAEASSHTNLLCGSINTVLLLTSGLTMGLAVHAIQHNQTKTCVGCMLLTMVLGLAFLAVKGFEYADDIHKHLVPGLSFAMKGEPSAQLFFYLYWGMTALHAVHMIIGLGLLGIFIFLTARRRYSEVYHTPIELTGIYWGFVDIIWIFLYPLLYLIGRHL